MLEDENGAPEGESEAATQVDEGAVEAAETPFDGLAREMGWFPKEMYKGDPDKWRPAEEYIKHSVKSTKALKKDLREVKETAERIARTSAIITERALAEQRAELEALHNQAVDLGDRAAAKDAATQLAKLDQQSAENVSHDDAFARDNPWYGKDEDATAFAVAVSHRLAAQGKSVEAQLEAAADAVRKRFPELFDDPAPKKAAPRVGAPTSRSSGLGNRPKTFEDLPADAKMAWANFDKSFKARGVAKGYPKEEYVKDYFENAG